MGSRELVLSYSLFPTPYSLAALYAVYHLPPTFPVQSSQRSGRNPPVGTGVVAEDRWLGPRQPHSSIWNKYDMDRIEGRWFLAGNVPLDRWGERPRNTEGLRSSYEAPAF